MQSTLNRQLKQSLDEATKTPEQRDISASEYLQQRKQNNHEKDKQEKLIHDQSNATTATAISYEMDADEDGYGEDNQLGDPDQMNIGNYS